MPDVVLPEMDVVAVEAEETSDDIFLPLPGPVAPAAQHAPARDGNGATTIEVPLAQAAFTEIPPVSLSPVATASPPVTPNAAPPAAESPAAASFPASPLSTGVVRPAARPAAPLAASDPLAPIKALSTEEKIALFS